MKRAIVILIISIFSVFTVVGHPPRAAENDKYPGISYDIEQINSAVADQWQQVFKSYSAAALVFMCQEAAQTSLSYQQEEVNPEISPTLVNAGGTQIASALEDTVRLKSCIDKFIRCDMHAASDGVVSVDEIHGCSTSFSNCWKRRKE